jgi:hypothetical protein
MGFQLSLYSNMLDAHGQEVEKPSVGDGHARDSIFAGQAAMYP